MIPSGKTRSIRKGWPLRTIKATVAGPVVTLRIDKEFFQLDLEEARRVRAEMNRSIERLVQERKGLTNQLGQSIIQHR